MDYSENNKRIVKNTLFLYFRMLLSMGVSLYTSRIVLAALGVDDFGIYNVVGGVVVLFSFLSNALSTASQRFMSFELGKNDREEVRRVFSMSMTVYISIILVVLFLAETVGLWFLNTHINIPGDKIGAANWVYQFSVFSTCIGILQIPYNASIMAYEKMSFYAYISIIEVIFKLIVALSLIYAGFDKLKTYSVLISIVVVSVFLIHRFYCRKTFETCAYYFFWDSSLYKKLAGFSGWTLFGSVANLSATQGVNILLNLFYGVTLNAAMGIANQVNNALYGFTGNFQTAFKPQIIKFYASGDRQHLEQLMFRSSKMSFFVLFALVFPVMLNMDMILRIWLKTVPEYAVVFCRLILVSSLLDALSAPLWMTIQAVGKIKKYQLYTSTAVGLNFVFSYIFLKNGFAPGVVFVIQIAINVVCFIIRLFFVQSYINMKIAGFIKNVLWRILPVIAVTIPVPFILSGFYTGWTGLIFTSLSFGLLVLFSVYCIGLTKPEQKNIRIIIANRLKHKNNFYS